jgi:hypothetical protein
LVSNTTTGVANDIASIGCKRDGGVSGIVVNVVCAADTQHTTLAARPGCEYNGRLFSR